MTAFTGSSVVVRLLQEEGYASIWFVLCVIKDGNPIVQFGLQASISVLSDFDFHRAGIKPHSAEHLSMQITFCTPNSLHPIVESTLPECLQR